MYFELKEANASKILDQKNEKSKTVAVIIAMCLNLGIQPPDVIKPDDAAKLLTWQIPKNSDAIIRNLQLQYQLWHPRAKYKLLPDPSLEDLKKVCVSLRKAAKSDRILIHYNGYGVPKPTNNGEIWVFNKQYTQYLPVSLTDIQHWTQSPAIFVWDCNNAGNLLRSYKKYAAQKDQDSLELDCHLFSNNIQFAACQSNEQLPLHPDVPADFFTCCLTTPILIALRCWVLQNRERYPDVNLDLLVDFPGKLNDRKTPLGELNWIFTAVVDTIAWSLFPRNTFSKLFRNDLLVAALYRNFLLAQRLMRQYQCTPICDPPISIYAHRHHLWGQFEMVLDHALKQWQLTKDVPIAEEGSPPAEYNHSLFFSDQLTAFEIWLEQRSAHVFQSPEQLPILLQVLLSQAHRSRALILLAKFLDLGAWAINEALSVGIFPYCLKLLQSPAPELRPVLAFIWARLLAIEREFQHDIVKDNGFLYFFQGLQQQVSNNTEVPFNDTYTTNCAFVLGQFVKNHPIGQDLCFKNGLIPLLCKLLTVDNDPLLIEWSLYALSAICEKYQIAINQALLPELNLINSVLALLTNMKIPRIRAACICVFENIYKELENEFKIHVVSSLLYYSCDLSVLVRKALLGFIASALIFNYDADNGSYHPLNNFDENITNSDPDIHSTHLCQQGLWKALLIASKDPHPPLLIKAQAILDAHIISFYATNTSPIVPPMVRQVIKLAQKPQLVKQRSFADSLRQFALTPNQPPRSSIKNNDVVLLIQSKVQALHNMASSPLFDYCSRLMITTNDAKYCVFSNKQQENICSFLKNQQLSAAKALLNHPIKPFEYADTIPIDHHVDGLVFHSAMPIMATFATNGSVHVYKNNKRTHTITGNHLSNTLFVNQRDSVMLLNTWLDGAISVNKLPFDGTDEAIQIHGSRPLTDVCNGIKNTILTQWHEQSGKLFMTGTPKIIRIFDMNYDLKTLEIHSRSHHDVTSCNIDNEGLLVFVGFGDGMLRLFDVRASTRDSMVFSSKAHQSRVINSKLQIHGRHALTATNTDLMIWDIRQLSLPLAKLDIQNSGCDMHDVLPLISISQPMMGVKLMTLKEWKAPQAKTGGNVPNGGAQFLTNNRNQWMQHAAKDLSVVTVIKQYQSTFGPRIYNELAQFKRNSVPQCYVASRTNITVYKQQ